MPLVVVDSIATSTSTCDRRICQTELYHCANPSVLERVKGIEPSSPAWKAGALPLSYTRVITSVVLPPALSPAGSSCSAGLSGECRIRTYEDRSQQIYSLSPLTAWVTPLVVRAASPRRDLHDWQARNAANPALDRCRNDQRGATPQPETSLTKQKQAEPAEGLEPTTC